MTGWLEALAIIVLVLILSRFIWKVMFKPIFDPDK